MAKIITLSDIRIKEIVIYEQGSEYLADVQYVVLDNEGSEWMTERVTLNDFITKDKGTITQIINVISAKIKARKQI